MGKGEQKNKNKSSAKSSGGGGKKGKKKQMDWDDDDYELDDLDGSGGDGQADPMDLLLDFEEGDSVSELGSKLWGNSPDRAAILNEPQNKQGETLLHLALLDGKGSLAKYFLENGSDANARDKSSRTPLHVALEMGEEAAAALMVGAAKLDANVYDRSGKSLLLAALENGALDAANSLLERGADPKKMDKQKNTALHFLFRKKAKTSEGEISTLVSRLMKVGCDLNATNMPDGLTPLMLAATAKRCSPTLIESLLKLGADPKAVSKAGQSAADFAEVAEQLEVVDMLAKRGASTGHAAKAEEEAQAKEEAEAKASRERAEFLLDAEERRREKIREEKRAKEEAKEEVKRVEKQKDNMPLYIGGFIVSCFAIYASVFWEVEHTPTDYAPPPPPPTGLLGEPCSDFYPCQGDYRCVFDEGRDFSLCIE